MDYTKANTSWNVNERLTAACDRLDWDEQTLSWKSYDGHWYSLPPSKVTTLEQSLELFVDSCKIGIDIQWIIANATLPIIKNILSHPAPDFTHNKINQDVWQLFFNLVSGNSLNQSLIWKECKDLLFHYLQLDFRQKDTCRLIVFNIYVVGRLAQNDGIAILKILLNSFHQEMYLQPSKTQGLNIFLEHFIIDENCISSMYQKLSTNEKLWILEFTIAHIEQGHFNVLPISIDFLHTVCEEFKMKSERIFNEDTNDIDLQELIVLLLVIATASNERYYEVNRLDAQILLQIGRLLRNVLNNDGEFDKAFLAVNRASDKSLKLILLTTISNFVKNSKRNKDLTRENGIIDCILDFIAAEGTDPLVYRSCIFTLIDICQSNALNKEHFIDIATRKKNPHLRTLLIDINYKRKN